MKRYGAKSKWVFNLDPQKSFVFVPKKVLFKVLTKKKIATTKWMKWSQEAFMLKNALFSVSIWPTAHFKMNFEQKMFGCVAMLIGKCMGIMWKLLELKTRPRFPPVRYCLSMTCLFVSLSTQNEWTQHEQTKKRHFRQFLFAKYFTKNKTFINI